MGRLVEPVKKKAARASDAVFEREESSHPLANCRPRGDRVVVRRDTAQKQTEGGILLPDSVVNTKMPTGTVVRVGPGRRDETGRLVPLDLRRGDRVILTSYAGLEISNPAAARQDEEYVILRDEDIIAII